jgi:hypothetical protein
VPQPPFLKPLKVEITIVWDVTPCSLVYTSTIVLEEPAASVFKTEVFILKPGKAGSSEKLANSVMKIKR